MLIKLSTACKHTQMALPLTLPKVYFQTQITKKTDNGFSSFSLNDFIYDLLFLGHIDEAIWGKVGGYLLFALSSHR